MAVAVLVSESDSEEFTGRQYNHGMSLPSLLYSTSQVRSFDAGAIASQDVTGYVLMQRAGDAALRLIRRQWPAAGRIVVVCGAGNNGGDGYVLARLLRQAGLTTVVFASGTTTQLAGDARRAHDDFSASGGTALSPPAGAAFGAALQSADVIVDALLGTGFHQPLRPEINDLIKTINAAHRPVLALDLPSGLDADTGRVDTACIRATHTITFVAMKQGLVLEDGRDFCGQLHFDSLQVKLPDPELEAPQLRMLDDGMLRAALPPRRRAAHKGDFGHVLIVGGDTGMAGAIKLAGEASLRVGAGLVTIATRAAHAPALADTRPELMCVGVERGADLTPLLERCSVIAIGPGLGHGEWARDLLDCVLSSARPLVLDADALNLLAQRDPARIAARLARGAVLTPHPGEAGRLLGCDTSRVQADRRAALRELCDRWQATVVLKGSGTLVGAANHLTSVCAAGNPGMATAGMGDVLTGVIAGIMAQCRDPWLAACAGVWAHARCGDRLAQRHGARGLLALELAAELSDCINSVAP
jgi:NAD(P)H-hydrate epimerase